MDRTQTDIERHGISQTYPEYDQPDFHTWRNLQKKAWELATCLSPCRPGISSLIDLANSEGPCLSIWFPKETYLAFIFLMCLGVSDKATYCLFLCFQSRKGAFAIQVPCLRSGPRRITSFRTEKRDECWYFVPGGEQFEKPNIKKDAFKSDTAICREHLLLFRRTKYGIKTTTSLNMTTRQRIFYFEGSDAEYISVLENWISTLLKETPPGNSTLSHWQPGVRPPTSWNLSQNDELCVARPQRVSKYPQPDHTFADLRGLNNKHDHSNNLHVTPAGSRDLGNDGLRVVQYNPHSSNNDSSKRRPDTPRKLKLHENSFLKTIPKSTTWKQRKRKDNFDSVLQNRYVISCLTSTGFIKLDNSAAIPERFSSLTRLPYEYAYQTSKLSEKNDLLRKIAAFRQIIIVSTCVVLLAEGISVEDVDSVIATCISSVETCRLERYRRAARWVNEFIQNLSENGWGDRIVHPVGQSIDHDAKSRVFNICSCSMGGGGAALFRLAARSIFLFASDGCTRLLSTALIFG